MFMVLAWTYNALGPLRRERRKSYRYRLFAVRDQLILLVAQGRLKEDDPLFQALYGAVNYLIPRAKPLSLHDFVRAWRAIPSSQGSELEALVARMKSDETLRQVGINFFRAVGSILLDVSITVRVAVIIMAKAEFFRRWVERQAFRTPFFQERSEAARIYGRVEHLAQRLA